MTSAITEHWLEQVFLPNAQRSPTLIVDSWTEYNQAKNVFREQVRFKTVPKKCTNLAQPLDIYFNRQFKAFYRRLSETVIREEEAFIVSQRANVGRLLNLTSNASRKRFLKRLKAIKGRNKNIGFGGVRTHDPKTRSPHAYRLRQTRCAFNVSNSRLGDRQNGNRRDSSSSGSQRISSSGSRCDALPWFGRTRRILQRFHRLLEQQPDREGRSRRILFSSGVEDAEGKGHPGPVHRVQKHVKEMYASIGYHISTHEESVRMECLVGGCLEALKNSTHYRVHLKDDHELEFSLLTDEQHSSYQAQVDRQRRAVIKLTKTYFPDAGISDVQNARGIHTCTKCCFTSVGHGIKIHAISHLHTRMACPIEGCLHKFQVDWTLKKHLMEAHKLGVKELDEEQHARFQKSEQEFKAASEEMKTVCFRSTALRIRR
ncbi:hypothetical protein L596_011661 [Steinernema carpocapsae]|uniref:C2H2-type domain-containing protein n=1 Tax=Steinernema carpocapsae TaxID=34508 RepID=A0A4U5NV08_STECR|nr:hypothetical protein L596_011661 [Steinernema carpocapsae]